MVKYLMLAVSMVAFVPGCSEPDPMIGIRADLQAQQVDKVRGQLETLARTGDGIALEGHVDLFVIYRSMLGQAVGTEEVSLQKKILAEYRWIADATGMKTNFMDMEASLEAEEKTRRFYLDAYTQVNGR